MIFHDDFTKHTDLRLLSFGTVKKTLMWVVNNILIVAKSGNTNLSLLRIANAIEGDK